MHLQSEWKTNSVDPDKMVSLDQLIWIYSVFKIGCIQVQQDLKAPDSKKTGLLLEETKSA